MRKKILGILLALDMKKRVVNISEAANNYFRKLKIKLKWIDNKATVSIGEAP